MSEQLKPCPFCGNKEPYFERTGTNRHSCIVECGNCGCRHESGDEGEHNGASWNTRDDSELTALRSQVAEARKHALDVEAMLAGTDEVSLDGGEPLGHVLASVKRRVAELQQKLKDGWVTVAQTGIVELQKKNEELQRQLDEQGKQEPVDVLEIMERVLLKINDHLSESKGMFPQVADEYRASMRAITDVLGHVRFYRERKRKFCEPLYHLPPNTEAMVQRAREEEREAALTVMRKAVIALAHAAESNPVYQDAYNELDAAIRARKG